jgi:hypothetical protein
MGASFGLGRIGEPAYTAGLVALLGSDDAGWVHDTYVGSVPHLGWL